MTEALVVVNPAAGGGRARQVGVRLGGLWAAAGAQCVSTQAPGHAGRLARQAAERGVERVVVVGGDGTLSDVANGLMGTEVGLGVVPAGTGNDFARAIRVPTRPEQAARLALEGPARWIDLPHIRTRQRSLAFVNVAGCGFDAEVVRRTPASGGACTYVLGVLKTLMACRARVLRLTVDGQPLERRVVAVAVANGPRYGAGLLIAPAAVVDDGLLDVCLLGDLGRFELLRLLPGMYRGAHRGHPRVEFFRCRELRAVSIAPGGVSCQADGELVGDLPATFSIQPRGLRCVTGAAA